VPDFVELVLTRRLFSGHSLTSVYLILIARLDWLFCGMGWSADPFFGGL
jgi:hypothetical protein